MWKMRKVGAISGVTVLVGVLYAGAFAQQPAPEDERDGEVPTLEERIETLERSVASLDLRTAGRDTDEGLDEALLARRVDALERELAGIRRDLQRIERAAESAIRTATDAQRIAAAAEREARNAASRVR